ncbi:MAG: grasp-with-spasm system SPASM domain peptide maturase [Bacteroidota bacterium]
MNENKVLILFEECRFVRGFKRSLICDLGRAEYLFIPNEFQELFNNFNNRITIKEIKKPFDSENKAVIDSYINYLIDKEFAFLCDKDEISLYTHVDTKWDNCSHITNAILDVGLELKYDLHHAISQLIKINCKHIIIRFYYKVDISYIDNMLEGTLNSIIESIELFIVFSNDLKKSDIKRLVSKNKRIKRITISASKKSSNYSSSYANIVYTTKKIDSPSCCGVIDPSSFTMNKKLFLENFNFNSCLNRKLSIDSNGNIKNCPALQFDYGNINNFDIAEIINKREFQELWHINKDKIETCKDCEFRYVCVDCRAIIENPSNIYSKPKNCKYDPYNAKWN